MSLCSVGLHLCSRHLQRMHALLVLGGALPPDELLMSGGCVHCWCWAVSVRMEHSCTSWDDYSTLCPGSLWAGAPVIHEWHWFRCQAQPYSGLLAEVPGNFA